VRISAVLAKLSRAFHGTVNTGPTRSFEAHMKVICGTKSLANMSMLELLNELPERKNQVPRDRIYSLMSMASDAAKFRIDYASSDDVVLA
jgi:hypothetical protein